jgi:hypothetical protein
VELGEEKNEVGLVFNDGSSTVVYGSGSTGADDD